MNGAVFCMSIPFLSSKMLDYFTQMPPADTGYWRSPAVFSATYMDNPNIRSVRFQFCQSRTQESKLGFLKQNFVQPQELCSNDILLKNLFQNAVIRYERSQPVPIEDFRNTVLLFRVVRLWRKPSSWFHHARLLDAEKSISAQNILPSEIVRVERVLPEHIPNTLR
jgi:hypothetical protein